MKQNEHIWISSEDLTANEQLAKDSENEFYNLPILNDLADEKTMSEMSAGTNRRDFLKYLGFSLGAATIAAACDTPVRKALPYVSKPDAIVPGIATYYASSFVKGGDFCPVLVKTREGRPIKVEGNSMAPWGGGGTSARAQASVLDLYDVARLRNPMVVDVADATDVEWDVIDADLKRKFASSRAIRIVGHTQMSPTLRSSLDLFVAKYPQAKIIFYDPISSSAILQANENTFGKRAIPTYHFDKTDLIVNFGADFLGTWVSPTEYAHQFAKRRKIKGTDGSQMSQLIQLESNMSYTGSNADQRVLIKPSEQGLAIAKLHNAIAGKLGGSIMGINGSLSNSRAEDAIPVLADSLVNAQGKCVVLSSSNNAAEQSLINAINQMLGNYGHTIDLDRCSWQRQGIDRELTELIEELNSGSVDAVIFLDDANPVFDHPRGEEIAVALESVQTKVACAYLPNETQDLCNYTCPVPHYMEAWGDVNPREGYYAIVQPVIHQLFNTRSLIDSMRTWAEVSPAEIPGEDQTYLAIKQYWETEIFPKQSDFATFQGFWDSTLHDGFALVQEENPTPVFNLDVASLSGKINRLENTDLEIQFYEPINVGNGVYANNPWLQELPDPVSRVVWDNVLHIPLRWNGRNAFEYYNDLDTDGMLVDVSVGETQVRLPIVRQFGQMQGTVSAALGYGRWVAGKAGQDVGSNLYPLLSTDEYGNIQYYATAPSVSGEMGMDERFASVQHHHTLGVKGEDESRGGEIINVDEKVVMTLGTGFQGGLTKRSILRTSNVDHLEESVAHLSEERAEFQHLNDQTLYPDRSEYYGLGHHWGLSVDLTACIGCAACQVACVAENNVPIVGKTEVNRHHEMTWMRIDRYYYGDVETPNVVYQPMMCQHCDNAPCENVCPVSATNHSSEGLNQMAYNRCVGTRYCANNCPYKVRRFNWLDYNTADLFPSNENDPFDEETPYYADNLTRMVLNPDVTVRARGVIEKCSMCVQRIQEGKLRAKTENRKLQDGDIKTACQTACPTGAIVFGDQNDPESELMQLQNDPKNYIALEETNVRSSVGYLMKVTNRNEKINSDEA